MTFNNLELWERANKVMPGMHSNLRTGDWGAYGLTNPHFMIKGKGARVTDVEGKDYVDYALGLGPGILGHGNEEYVAALKKQLDNICFAASGLYAVEQEVEWAEKFVKHVPCAEKVRLCVTGTDAVQLAIRLARAFTGRRYFIRFEGHYHGWLDNVLGGMLNENPLGMPFAYESSLDRFGTDGRDPEALLQSFKLPWNDVETLERVLGKYGEQVALIIMEAINCNGGCCPPRPGYLERVRELCDKHGIVLCFDEVITGFRVGLSGAQGFLGVVPDISTFGKSMAAGIPVSAVAGKARIMNLLADGKVAGIGTFNGYPLGLAACLATISILERDNGAVYQHIDTIQKKLTGGLKDLARKHGLPALIQGPRGAFNLYFIDGD
ncbi:MAG: aminotransferase class III-fold pyridoxal phosphate-dependent enzyme, partial [Spirochaetales bacterium]|nr:aminotransferase class III-fold pyridoxal phosphate-dependent enzyme [Spirochaetales bacterium]